MFPIHRPWCAVMACLPLLMTDTLGNETPTAAKAGATKPAAPSAAAHGKAGQSKSGQRTSSHDIHWGYEGAEGPENWGKLEEAYGLCSTGKNQSPININAALESELPALGIAYQQGGSEVVNNGHTIQVGYGEGSTLTLDGVAFTLKQFHFHAPSENTIDGKSFPMEVHLVHADVDGNLAVIGVMIQEGAWNRELSKAWAVMPMKAEAKATPKTSLDANGLLPKNREYYRFSGSLTTPPCSEGVRWLVMKTPITAEKAQIKKFTDTMQHHTNRPVQALNGRPVLQ